MKSAKISKFILMLIILALFNSMSLLAQTIVFSDDFESGTSNWVLTGTWGLNSTEFYSGSNSLTESPTGNYTNMQSTSATLTSGIDLSSYLGAEISFWAKYDIEAAFDFMYLELSKDGGTTFLTIDEFTDVSAVWTKYTYNIGTFAGYSNVKVRFRFYSDQYVTGDGMYIDDVEITGQLNDSAPPLIIHDGPDFYEGTQDNFIVNCSISDVSGVSSTSLFYFVDGIGPNMISGTNVSRDEYQFIIPALAAGTNVWYKIKAVDGSSQANETDTSSAPAYNYISGSYLSYDDGVVNTVSTITGTAAVAVKISVPAGLYGFLKTALIRNYRDVNHVNDDMLFHVWDDNNGLPGNDLITPFLVTPEATLDDPFPFTRIDLRGYSPQLDDLTGDFFIGFTVPQNSVSIINSGNSNSRSYYFDGTSWSVNSTDYEFRAIIRESSSPLPVELTTFTADVNEQTVKLIWQTATEVNNYGFEIERQKEEISSENIEWEKIGFVDGFGNSNSPKYYFYEDNSYELSGKYFYRLKQIDIDGKYEYSDLIEVNINPPKEFTLEQNYPNPFNPSTKIKFSIPELASGFVKTNVRLVVYDILGKRIATLVNEEKSPGNYEVIFDASKYPSGLYVYTILANNFSYSKKMILMK